MVLVRPPADAFVSALRRFWLPRVDANAAGPVSSAHRPPHTMLVKLEMLVLATVELARHVAALPCDSTLFLSYELLTRYPHEHVAPLAALLRVRESDPRLVHFLLGDAARKSNRTVAQSALLTSSSVPSLHARPSSIPHEAAPPHCGAPTALLIAPSRCGSSSLGDPA